MVALVAGLAACLCEFPLRSALESVASGLSTAYLASSRFHLPFLRRSPLSGDRIAVALVACQAAADAGVILVVQIPRTTRFFLTLSRPASLHILGVSVNSLSMLTL